MKKCTKCGKKMKELKDKTPEGIFYTYYKCSCGEEILDMKQLHKVAQKYRLLKTYKAKLTKWGESLGLRIPKELVKEYKFKEKKELKLIPEEEGIKIVG